jgi:hypothetical protein
VFSSRFFFRIEYLVLLELDVPDDDDFTVLWNLYAIDIAATIANEVANMCPGLSFPCRLFLILQDLFSNRVGSAAIGVDVCDVRLIHKVCHVLIVDPEPF